ncbi:MAG: cyclic nucleotide-binding domain-containing protein [Clostridium sp.]|nr:cyclic nucleotide-binding domain-containing protein [Clostridium sp.]
MRSTLLNQSHIKLLEEYGLVNLNTYNLRLYHFHPGEMILQEGAPMDACYLIVKGDAKVYITSENGKALLMNCLISEGFIGEMELLTKSFHSYCRYVAETTFVCIRIPYSVISLAMQTSNVFLNKLTMELSSKLYTSMQCFLHRVHYTAEERLSAHILQHSSNGNFSAVLNDVSLSLGISYRHLFRLLEQFCVLGILEKTQQGYKILDYKELEDRTSKQ